MIISTVSYRQPYFLHFNGGSYKGKDGTQKLAYDLYLTSKNEKFSDNQDYCDPYIFSIMYNSHKELPLERQLSDFSNFHFLSGRYKNWKNYNKIKIIQEEIRNCRSDVFCFLDGFDVIQNKSLKNICCDVGGVGGKVIFNAEKNFYYRDSSDKHKARKIFNEDKRYPYLNSGCLIGKKEVVAELFNKINFYLARDQYKNRSDQTCMMHLMYSYGDINDLIKLDYENNFFMCMNKLKVEDFRCQELSYEH